jgi:hypothetical protein
MSDDKKSGCTVSFGVGSVISCIISYALNGSFWWAVLHFFFGWLYVLYAVFFRTKEILPALQKMFGGA